MKSGYDKFFVDARKAKSSNSEGKDRASLKKKSSLKTKSNTSLKNDLANMSEAELRRLFAMDSKESTKVQRKKATQSILISSLICLFGMVVAGALHLFPEMMEGEWPKIELDMFSSARAENKDIKTEEKGKSDEEKNLGKKREEDAAASSGKINEGAGEGKLPDLKHWTADELKMLAKLDERNRELEAKEARLKKMEAELDRQSSELEKKLKQLEEIRKHIANKLQDKVEVDQDRVAKLVDFYANMKPQNAAKVFETIDEDLAVEVLIRMKKKNAADIMNLLPAQKSQVLSEKFAGYRSR